MKTLFIHYSEKAKEDTFGRLYTDGSYNLDIWQRYLENFKIIRVLFRKDSQTYTPSQAKLNFNLIDDRVSVFFLKNRHESLSSLFNLNNLRLNKELLKNNILKSDFIIIRGNYRTAVKYAKKFNKPYLVEVVGCPYNSLKYHSFLGKLLAPISYLSMRKTTIEAPYVSYVTKEYLQRRYKSKGLTLSCSDVSVTRIKRERLEKKINRRKEDTTFNIVTIGALDVSYKNQRLVIKVLSKLEDKKISYHLIGGGDYTKLFNYARKMGVLDCIHFHGHLPHKDVLKILYETDIYIQPSYTEGLPRSIIEAMSQGCMVLGSNVGGIPELVEKKYLFSPNKWKQLYKVLKKIDRDTISKEMYRNWEQSKEFEKQKLDRKRNKFYKEILKDSNLGSERK